MSEPTQETGGLHPLLPKAVALHQSGSLSEAARVYETILAESPANFHAQHLLGVIDMQEGRLREAQQKILLALESDPRNIPALSNLTAALLRNGQLEEALACGLMALGFGEDLDLYVNVGSVLYELGRYREAIDPLTRAFDTNPNSTIVCNLLGACHLKSGDAPEAARIFEQAVSAAPYDSDGWSNLSAAFGALADYDRSLQCAEKAVELSQDSSAALGAQASALFELSKIDEAIATYKRAVQFKPTVEILCGLANALITSGLHDEAKIHLRQAIEMNPNAPLARWVLAMSVLKPIYSNDAEVLESRTALAASLGELETWFATAPNVDAFSAVAASQPFYIAYHPLNNRELLSRYGDICATWIKTLPASLELVSPFVTSRKKIRLGFASAHIRNHSVWNAITKGWVENLDRTKFEIFIFQLSAKRDEETARARRFADFLDDQPKSLANWMKVVRDAHLDFLIYTDIGMDPLTTQLASVRLAPLQAATWGHPESTGLPTVDYFISAENLEPPNAQANYRERVVRLPNLGVHIQPLKPKIGKPNMKFLRLPTDEPLLLCPGTPFKYLPQYDRIWGAIAKGLEANGSGRLVFFASSVGSMYVLLLDRLRASFAREGIDFDARAVVVPVLDRERFFGLMHESAMALDTPGFSGFNTAMQAIECDLPYLAYEGEYMRGRLGSCIMRRLQIPELIATNEEQFIARAIQLAADKKALKKIRSQLVSRRKILFSDLEPVRALESFIRDEVTAGRQRFSAA